MPPIDTSMVIIIVLEVRKGTFESSLNASSFGTLGNVVVGPSPATVDDLELSILQSLQLLSRTRKFSRAVRGSCLILAKHMHPSSSANTLRRHMRTNSRVLARGTLVVCHATKATRRDIRASVCILRHYPRAEPNVQQTNASWWNSASQSSTSL